MADREADSKMTRKQRRRAHGPRRDRNDMQVKDMQAKDKQAAACQARSQPQDDMEAQRQYQQLVKQQWPADEIAAALQLDETGRARLEVLQDTAMSTMRDLSPCPPKDAGAAPARLAAVKPRLQTLRAAV